MECYCKKAACETVLRRAWAFAESLSLSLPTSRREKGPLTDWAFLIDYKNRREHSSGNCWQGFIASDESLHIHLFLIGQDESSFGKKANVLRSSSGQGLTTFPGWQPDSSFLFKNDFKN